MNLVSRLWCFNLYFEMGDILKAKLGRDVQEKKITDDFFSLPFSHFGHYMDFLAWGMCCFLMDFGFFICILGLIMPPSQDGWRGKGDTPCRYPSTQTITIRCSQMISESETTVGKCLCIWQRFSMLNSSGIGLCALLWEKYLSLCLTST